MIAIVSVLLASRLGLPFSGRFVATVALDAFAECEDLPLTALTFCGAACFFFTAEAFPAADLFAAAFGAAFFAVFFGADFLLERAIQMSSSGYVSLFSGRKGG
jgi:hypothetical protein